MAEDIEVYGKTLYSYARQKCLEEGAFQKEEADVCVKEAMRTEKSKVDRERNTMKHHLSNINRILKEDPEKINMDYLDSEVIGIHQIASGHVTKYGDRQAGSITGTCTHLANLTSEWRSRDKSKMPVEKFKNEADALTKILDSYME